MLHQVAARNYDKESRNQRAINRQCFAWSVVTALHPAERNSRNGNHRIPIIRLC